MRQILFFWNNDENPIFNNNDDDNTIFNNNDNPIFLEFRIHNPSSNSSRLYGIMVCCQISWIINSSKTQSLGSIFMILNALYFQEHMLIAVSSFK